MIAIDFEYNDKRLVCVCCKKNDTVYKFWLADNSDTDKFKNFVEDNKNEIFCCHALEKAEGQAFQRMNIDPTKYKWYDTYTVESIKTKATNLVFRENSLFESLSLVALEQKYLNKTSDETSDRSKHKHMMRDIIIADKELEEHKEDILDYCAEDIDSLEQIANQQCKDYAELIQKYRVVNTFNLEIENYQQYTDSEFWMNAFVRLCHSVAIYSKCAYKGLNINDKALKVIAKKDDIIEKLKRSFNDKFNAEAFVFEQVVIKGRGKTKSAITVNLHGKKNSKVLESLASDAESEIQKLHKDFVWPKSDSGKFKFDKDTLKSYCICDTEFAKDLSEIETFRSGLAAVANFDKTLITHPCHHMFGAQTGRCTPKPTDGFLPCMGQLFRSFMNPRDDKHVLVSIDYSAQETAIAAAWGHDKNMLWCYQQPDFYIAAGYKFGVIDDEHATKKTHPKERVKCKLLCLTSNYGQGYKATAKLLNISEEESKDLIKRYTNTFGGYSYSRKRLLQNCAKSNVPLVLLTDDNMPYVYIPEDTAKHCKDKDDIQQIKKFFHCKSSFFCKPSTSLGNAPIQSAGATMLRYIIDRLNEENIDLVCSMHDEVILNLPLDSWKEQADRAIQIMIDAFKNLYGKDACIHVGEPEIAEWNGILIPHSDYVAPRFKKLVEFGVLDEDDVKLT